MSLVFSPNFSRTMLSAPRKFQCANHGRKKYWNPQFLSRPFAFSPCFCASAPLGTNSAFFTKEFSSKLSHGSWKWEHAGRELFWSGLLTSVECISYGESLISVLIALLPGIVLHLIGAVLSLYSSLIMSIKPPAKNPTKHVTCVKVKPGYSNSNKDIEIRYIDTKARFLNNSRFHFRDCIERSSFNLRLVSSLQLEETSFSRPLMKLRRADDLQMDSSLYSHRMRFVAHGKLLAVLWF